MSASADNASRDIFQGMFICYHTKQTGIQGIHRHRHIEGMAAHKQRAPTGMIPPLGRNHKLRSGMNQSKLASIGTGGVGAEPLSGASSQIAHVWWSLCEPSRPKGLPRRADE